MDFAGRRAQLATQDVVNGLEFWIVWALLTPLVVAAIRRWPLNAPTPTRVILHATVAAVLAAVHNVIVDVASAFAQSAFVGSGFDDALRRSANPTAFVWGMFTGVIYYAIVGMFYAALAYRRLYTTEQIGAAALRAELTQSKLDVLRSQLRPHFLFNTLNAISVFVSEDAAKAQQMILRLSTLLRRSLDEEAHEVAFEEELAFANDYLDIQRGRFGDRLAVALDVRDDVLRANVPVFVLQPLLENAIEHGRSDERRSTVTLHASRVGDSLYIAVIDDGPGMASDVAPSEGIGLSNTRARLEHLYGRRSSVEWGPAEPRADQPGTRVAIRLPFRTALI
jgi:signal transduction histidine kinase